MLVDAAAWVLALLAASATHSPSDGGSSWLTGALALSAVAIGVQWLIGNLLRQYLGATRIGGTEDTVAVLQMFVPALVALLIARTLGMGAYTPLSSVMLSASLALIIMLGVRLIWRISRDRNRRPGMATNRKRVLVFGAGEGAEQIVRTMLRDPDSQFLPVAMLDDDRHKSNRQFQGIKVQGTRDNLAEVAEEFEVDVLLIAVPSAGSALIGEINDAALDIGLETRVLPPTSELLGSLTLGDIRELTETDLLGRAEVDVDEESIAAYITGRRVLVTGAGGSIGSELCRQLSRLEPESLVMLDRDETGLHGVQLSIEGRALLDNSNLVVANIRDRVRVFEIFEKHQPEVVFHAAALKHLSLLEMHPEEGHKTNVLGSGNIADACAKYGVDRFVNVSTDKAATPTSVLGRTKREAEIITAELARETGRRFVSVRFGNVLGSRGSVLPTFKRQIKNGGPVTVTDPAVTRYFMTIPEAVRLVLQAGAIGRPGETMILDMGEPVLILDMAKRLIRHMGSDIDIVYTGLRPGEKLHEILISDDETAKVREHPRIMHVSPETVPAGASDPTGVDVEQSGRTAL